MAKKSLTKHGKKDFDSYLSDKSVLELVDTMTYLDSIKPYAELSKNGDIGEFFEKKHKDIPIHNAKEFNSFYESLTDRIGQLADTDKIAKTYLQHATYQKELNELPSLMNKLENISFDKLTPKFKAVMEYVYGAVINNGFEMDENGLFIKRDDYVSIGFYGINKDGDEEVITRFYLKKEKYRKNEDLKINVNCLIDNYIGEEYSDAGSAIKEIKDFMVKIGKDEFSGLMKQIKTILSLPQIMNKFLKKRISSLENCLEEIK